MDTYVHRMTEPALVTGDNLFGDVMVDGHLFIVVELLILLLLLFWENRRNALSPECCTGDSD